MQKARRDIIRIDEEKCDGCGLCATACAEGAIRIIDGKARLISESYCDGLGACLGECPQGALTIEAREAAEFDEAAVQAHMQPMPPKKPAAIDLPLACGCPSTHLQTFDAAVPASGGGSTQAIPSALTHWPVQIRLVPPTAPFLKGARLLVAADCTPVACPDFHRVFLPGRVVLLGCPKFDDADAYVQKFAAIFATADIRDVTVLIMEVPCCSSLPVIVRRAMALAGKTIPLETVVISSRGIVINRILDATGVE